MYCKFLKLTNGEDIIVQTDDECSTFNGKEFINVVDPIQIASVKIPRGPLVIETYIMQPWLKMAVSDVVQIPTKNIVVAVDIQDVAKKQYYQYLEETSKKEVSSLSDLLQDEDSDGEELTEEDAFEEFMQSLRENLEEDDDGTPRTSNGRTIH